jgi:hypothetical protein
MATTQQDTTKQNGNHTTGAQAAATATAQEGSRAWFRLAGAVIDEGDRQIEDGIRMLSKFHEQLAASRRNLLKLAEESIDGTLEAARTMAGSITNVMRSTR